MYAVVVNFPCSRLFLVLWSFLLLGLVFPPNVSAAEAASAKGTDKPAEQAKTPPPKKKIGDEKAAPEEKSPTAGTAEKKNSAPANSENTGPEAVREEELVVTAARVPTKRETTGVRVTVIGGEENAVHQNTTAAEALRMVPGTTPVVSGTKGSQSSLFIRGGNSNHTLVLYDGFKVNQQGGRFNFESLDPLALDRIELARGPGSSLFGTDAVVGTVNFITKRGAGRPKLTVSGAGGTYGTDRETLAVEGRHKKFAYNVSSARLHRNSWKENNSELETWNYAARFDYQLTEEQAVKLIVRGSDLKRGWYESSGSGYGTAVEPADPNDQIHDLDWLVGFEYRARVLPIWETVLKLGYWGQDRRLISDQPNPASTVFGFGTLPGRTFTQERRPSLDWQNNILTWKDDDLRNTVIVGVQTELERFNQDDSQFGANIETDRGNVAGYLQDRLELFGRAFVNLGLRQESNGDFGGFLTARADASILIPECGGRVHGSVGNAFRAPSFYELHAPGFGNTGLDPEKNFAFDAGYEQKFWKDRIRLDATYFENRFKDLINFNFGSGAFENLAQARTSGWELTAEFRPLRRLLLRGTATFLHTQDDDGHRLLRRPPHTYTAQIIAKPLDGLDVSLELLGLGDRTDIGPAGRVRNPGYVRADAAVSWRFYKYLRVFGRVENIGDVQYEDAATFPSEGANFLGGLEFSMRF